MPSEKHSELIRRSLVWLSNIATQKGIRSAPECTLGDGYVADGAAILNLQFQWDCKFFITPYYKLRKEKNYIETDDFTFVIEAKVSKSDFSKTFIHNGHAGDRMKPRGNFHFIVVSKGLADHVASCYTDFWGILEESRNGLRLVKLPAYCPQSFDHLHEFAYRILRYSDPRKFMLIDLREVPENENTRI